MKVKVAIEWKIAPADCQIEVVSGKFLGGVFANGEGEFEGNRFTSSVSGPGRAELAIDADNMDIGADPTMVSICAETGSFTFFLRDVCAEQPILIPDYGVAVTTPEDKRNFEEIQKEIAGKGLLGNFQRINLEPEETYEQAAANTRQLQSPIWMGLSRDVRIFEMGTRQPMVYTDWIRPRWHGHEYFKQLAGTSQEDGEYYSRRYGFVAGRGWNCDEQVSRRIDEGTLPIFHYERIDENIRYEHTSFVTLEKTLLTTDTIRGTHSRVADGMSECHAFTKEQEAEFMALRDGELQQNEETVLCCRVVAVNTSAVPRYAYFKAIFPHYPFGDSYPHTFDAASGFSIKEKTDLVFGINKINGKSMPQEEIAILLKPGESCLYEFFFPHQPIPKARAKALAKRDISELLEQCREFWKTKLAPTGQINVPEKRINEMVRAGFLHSDLTTYGLEPDGSLAVADGTYGPVGAETWVNIVFYDSLGQHDLAKRSLMYFLEKQRDDGFIQAFEGYMLDTGCVLFALGEHYRYTHDDEWVKEISQKVLKSCNFIINWRKDSLKEELRGKGYGLMPGRVADPKDEERIYMLNAYAYNGLSRAAEMLANLEPEQSQRIKAEAERFKTDIRTAFLDSLAHGPVIPIGNGTWCPTAAAWVGPQGPKCLFTDTKQWWSHGSMSIRDAALGPCHLISQEVFAPDEQVSTFLLNFYNELMFSQNVAASQPYYSSHYLIHLWRNEPKLFLKAYYNTFPALMDRETYTFWEHFYHESPHKTHEEAEFLMQTRWMLYLEQGRTLKLLAGVPRTWLGNGKKIELKDMASYFGKLSLSVVSKTDDGIIEAQITCNTDRKPDSVELRLPHPLGQKATAVEGGAYNADTETVVVKNFRGQARIKAFFLK